MPEANHIVRGRVRALLAGQINFGVLSYSTFMPANNYNIYQAFQKRVPIQCRGVAVGCGSSSTLAAVASVSGGTLVRPGESPGDSDTGYNTSRTLVRTGDFAGGGTAAILELNRANLWDSNWDYGLQVEPVFTYRSTPASGSQVNHNDWRLRGFTGSATAIASNDDVINNIDAAAACRVRVGSAYSRVAVPNTNLCYVQSWFSTEQGYFKPIALGLRATTAARPNGIFYAPMMGEGGLGTPHYFDETGVLVSPGSPNYTARMTNEAINGYYAAWKVNVLLVALGLNESGGINADWYARFVAIIARHRAAAATAGIDLTVSICSQADYADDTSNANLLRTYMRGYAAANEFAEYFDHCGYQRDVSGPYPVWKFGGSGTVLMQDAFHPLASPSTFRDNYADGWYATMSGPNVGLGKFSNGGLPAEVFRNAGLGGD